uniref:Uncharacterized protein n=2 Tax=Fagus sylvatica TaxID=28930 RepID=A0A2N9F1U1_FAGSY
MDAVHCQALRHLLRRPPVPPPGVLLRPPPPEGAKKIMEGGAGNEDSTQKGLHGTGLELPVNRHGNLKSASSDQNLKHILLQIKSSKTPNPELVKGMVVVVVLTKPQVEVLFADEEGGGGLGSGRHPFGRWV